jgi:hypothetical protein
MASVDQSPTDSNPFDSSASSSNTSVSSFTKEDDKAEPTQPESTTPSSQSTEDSISSVRLSSGSNSTVGEGHERKRTSYRFGGGKPVVAGVTAGLSYFQDTPAKVSAPVIPSTPPPSRPPTEALSPFGNFSALHSPSRLAARSPRNNSTTRDDLSFLFDALNSSADDDSNFKGSSASIIPTSTSTSTLEDIRSLRRRGDLDHILERSKAQETSRREAESASIHSRNGDQTLDGDALPGQRLIRPTGGVQGLSELGGIIGLAPGVIPSATIPSSKPASLYADSVASLNLGSPTADRRKRERARKIEVTENSQACWVWMKENQKSASTGLLAGFVGKAPLIRDVR